MLQWVKVAAAKVRKGSPFLKYCAMALSLHSFCYGIIMVASSNIPNGRAKFPLDKSNTIQTKTHPRLPLSLLVIAGLAVVIALLGLVLEL